MAKTVLIVEDNELNKKPFRDLLEAHGFDTLETSDGDTPEALLKRADDGLYEARRGGRNRVIAVAG